MLSSLLAIFPILAVSGCEDVATPDELDHAQIIAIRVSPPSISAGETATVDALVTDNNGVVRVVVPTVTPRIPAALIGVVEPSDIASKRDGVVTIEAPSNDVLQAIRAGLDLSDDAEIPLLLDIDLLIEDEFYFGDKLITFGESRNNPSWQRMRSDGEDLGEELVFASSSVNRLELVGVESHLADPDSLEFAWLTSLGSLENYRSAKPTLTVEKTGEGSVVVVVRDGLGGSSWQVAPARTE